MTILTAEKKICPFIRDASFNMGNYAYQDKGTAANINCIADNCMAWVVTKSSTLIDTKVIQRVNGKTHEIDSKDSVKLIRYMCEGYCSRLGVTECTNK